ncbi:MAG: gluconate permease [Pirellulales bacterium]|nr:gluconate permease [Pirellulales bacterium]
MFDSLVSLLANPLVILVIGVVTVIGMIIILRVNAFLALVTAAILVSLLSSGRLADKIERVAGAFGDTAAKIGIVIAMAAIIGKCLMDSGAADRIVRSFLKVLGEKRAATALVGSGFVLSVPVFFDTVFYLLVPLARSLWKRTHKNYVLYITAIATGGAITHTLVPPTPGPLIMADTLGIDIGMMILIGTLIGLPTAVVGLLVCRVMNRLMDLPMRPYGDEPESEPLADDELPSLWVSLLPVLLPVVLISTNTVTSMYAEQQHAALARRAVLQRDDAIFDWPGVWAELAGGDRRKMPLAQRQLLELLPADVQQSLAAAESKSDVQPPQARLREALMELAAGNALTDNEVLLGLPLGNAAKNLRDRGIEKLSKEDAAVLNWCLLEAVLPGQVRTTGLGKASQVTALLGDPNLALLLSAAIAMWVLVRRRGLSFAELAKKTETALMSGGVIILITSGGGAFGAMLRQCGVKEAIEGMVDSGGQNVGLLMLLLGYGIGTVMKIAQGSGTVSMITTSGIMASMGVSSAMLGCHPVYLAAAIGAGSLTGSWMNDSGFWIFARMSGLTEIEALKTWTILLAILGVTALGVTLLLAWAMPLV